MNKRATSIVILGMVGLSAKAQFTITQSNMPNPSTREYKVSDTMPDVAITAGKAGANQIWDLSKLHKHKTDSTFYLDAAVAPMSSKFPGATLAIKPNDSTYEYVQVTASHAAAIGVISGKQTIKFKNPDRIFLFPCTYLTYFKDTQNFQIKMKQRIKVAGHTYDSLRITINQMSNDSLNGYGTVITPQDTFTNVLRLKRYQLNVHTGEERDTATGQWVKDPLIATFVNKNDTIIVYEWYAEHYRVSVANLVYTASTKRMSGAYLTNKTKAYNGINTLYTDNGAVKAFPNPATKELNIVMNNDAAAKMEVYDMTGKLITALNIAFDRQVTINTGNYNSGLYLYKVSAKDGAVLHAGKFNVIK